MTILQADQADIAKAGFWNSVGGGDIVELVGDFTTFRFNDVDYRGRRVTIDSSTADSMAGTYLTRVYGFVFAGDKWAPSEDGACPYALRIDTGDDLVFDSLTMTGPDPYGMQGDGLKFRNLSNCRFIDFKARRLIEAVTGDGATDWLSTNHEFTELSNDGWQVFNALRCAWYDGTDLGRVTDPNQDPATAPHPDLFQFPVLAGGKPSQDITVERCVGGSLGGQGIFLSNEAGLPVAHRNVRIVDNRVRCTAMRGISVDNGDGVLIQGNLVATMTDAVDQSTIIHTGSVNVNDWKASNYVVSHTNPAGRYYPPIGTKPGVPPIPPIPTPTPGDNKPVIDAQMDVALMLTDNADRIAAINAVKAVP